MDGFFPRLGRGVARFHKLVIGLWLVAIVAAIPGVMNVKGALRSGGFEVADSDSGQGARILEQEFGRRTVTTGVLVFASDTLTIEDPTFSKAVTDSISRVRALEGVTGIVSVFDNRSPRFVAADRKTTYAIVNFTADEEEAKKLTPDVRKLLEEQPAGIRGYLMGFPALSYDLAEGSAHDLKKAELTSMPLTLLLLLLVFGTILAAGLPLILGVTAVIIALAGIYLLAQRVETSIFAMNTATMIGLGLGIDFSLLMVSRFREELKKGLSAEKATTNTVATSGRSIVFSGLTVMLGLSVLCLYDLVLIRSIAIGMLLVTAMAVLGAVTLLPALMALFGSRLNSFDLKRMVGRRFSGASARVGLRPYSSEEAVGADSGARHPSDGGRWHRWSLTIMRHPWVFLIASLAFLLALAWPARELNAIGSGGARGMPADSETRQAFETLLGAFGPGEATPVTVVVRSPRENGAWDPTTLEGVYQLVKRIEADPRVQRVESLVSLTPPSITQQQFTAMTPETFLANPQSGPFVPLVVNVRRPNDTANRRADSHSIAIYSKQDELNQDTIDLVKDLRSTIVPSVPALRDTEVHTTGQTAIILDYRDKLFNQFPLMVGLVLLVTYLVLMVFFHSLVLPLKAIAMNVVAILASYGVLVLVFQHGIGEGLLGFDHLGRLSMFAPVILFSILFGLSTDYEVFLLSRVKELYAQSHDNERSVAMGLEHTAGIITAAGLIMIVVFGSFALGSTLVIKELGVGLAVAVLLDSTIIRIVMVPASMKLMGAGNWWMPRFLSWIPDPEVGEGVDEPIAASRLCLKCHTPLRPSARFCGRCGAQQVEAREAAPIPIILAPGHAVLDAPGSGGRTMRMPDAIPPQSGGVHRLLVTLANGHHPHPTWLVLRDCRIEQMFDGGDALPLQIDGLELTPLPGREPEIQIRYARVRMLGDGRQPQRAQLLLRDCQVERLPDRIPLLQISGLDLAPLPGHEPEIQISHARVRLGG